MADIVKNEYALTEVGTSMKKDTVKTKHLVSIDSSLVRKILRLTLKLAYAGVYNDKLNLILNGAEIKRTNFVKYLMLAVSDRTAVIKWPPSFLIILRRSDIVPAEVINESLKKLLRSTHKKKSIIIDRDASPSYSYPLAFSNIHVDPNDSKTSQSISGTELVAISRKTRRKKDKQNQYENIRFSNRIADKKNKFDGKNDRSSTALGKSKWTRISE